VIKPRPYDFYSIATYLQPLKILRAGLQLSGNTTIIQMLTYARIGTILFTGDKFNEKHLPGAFDELKTLGEYLDEKLNKLPQHGEWDKTLEPAKVQAVQDIIHSFEVSLERFLL
jgi:hypothetical protein